MDAAVAVVGIDAGRPGLDRELDVSGLDAGDLLGGLEAVLAGQVVQVVPDSATLVGLAVLELDLDLAGEERGLLGQALGVALVGTLGEALGLGGRVGEGGLVGQEARSDQAGRGLDPTAGGRDDVLLALPLAKLGIPVGQALVGLVPHHEALVLAVFLDVGLGEQAGLHLDAAVALDEPALGQPRLVLNHEERSVGPAAHHGVVVGLVLDDPVEPAQAQGAVGAGAQGQPDVGLLAGGADARVDEDVVGSMGHDVVDAAVVGVVVGDCGLSTPLDVDLRLLLDLHPRRAHLVGHDAAEVARTLADLVGKVCVGGAEELLHALVRTKRPNAGGAAHNEDGLSAVLVDALAQTLAGELEGLGQRDADPTGIVLALGVGALDGVTHTVGVISSLQRSLRLRAAVTAGMVGLVVALDLDGLAVLDGDPHAALDLAAGTAARTDALDLAGSLVDTLGQSLQRLGGRGSESASSRCDCGCLDEVTAAHGELSHTFSLHSGGCSHPFGCRCCRSARAGVVPASCACSGRKRRRHRLQGVPHMPHVPFGNGCILARARRCRLKTHGRFWRARFLDEGARMNHEREMMKCLPGVFPTHGGMPAKRDRGDSLRRKLKASQTCPRMPQPNAAVMRIMPVRMRTEGARGRRSNVAMDT